MDIAGTGKLWANGVECGVVDYALETWVRRERNGGHGTIEPREQNWSAILNARISGQELVLELKTGHCLRITIWHVDDRVRARAAIRGKIPELAEIIAAH